MINCSNVVVRNAFSENGFKNVMVVDCSNVTIENATSLNSEDADLYLNNVTGSTFKDVLLQHTAWDTYNLYAYDTQDTTFENITTDANSHRGTGMMLKAARTTKF